ncbi:GTP cyclohydrolase I FolE [Clostridium sp. 'White wine YQ']|uniref:GTP cyclohydrolase I FolE n=1 Tax=Clostridium sp. 'White wine YQ' TaxID=3027474 RepID=UPI0023656A27|nr:GTP cyclohydrolase I FolE [Clostridium sp. 'White wine YQ']MDD7795310.1 GTP cyclohydrolase I FolE [Clostridium sp. 'White wine YQ']
MKKEIDKKSIEKNIREILIALGDNPDREGLKDTPKRVAKMFEEVFEGMLYSNEEIAEKFGVTFEEEDFALEKHKNMVIVKDIPIFSYCEHHIALMYNMKVSVGYIPNEKVIGLSKIARIAEMVGKRLQLQERIAMDIADVIEMATDSKDIAVIVEGEHSCMTSRGVKKPGSVTKTTVFRGEFDKKDSLRQEFLLLL